MFNENTATSSPLKELSFSYADTSFEKVYAKLQKDIKFVESLNNESTNVALGNEIQNFRNYTRSPRKITFSQTREKLIHVNPCGPVLDSQHISDARFVKRDASLYDFPDDPNPVSTSLPNHLAELEDSLLACESDSALDDQDEDEIWENFNDLAGRYALGCDDVYVENVSSSQYNHDYIRRFKPLSYSHDILSHQSFEHEATPDNATVKQQPKLEKRTRSTTASVTAKSTIDKNVSVDVDSESQDEEDILEKFNPSKPKFDVYKHIRKDGESVVENTSKVYHCGICGNFAALSKYTLEKHWKNHYVERPHKCHLCEKAFKSAFLLRSHLNRHEERKLHECSKCSKSFPSLGELRKHVRYRHDKEKAFQCSECEYSTPERGKLKRHMRVHTGERPFKCHLCDYCTSDNFNLKRHLRSHTGEKPFQCPICDARFSQAESMKEHVSAHTGNKAKYQCEYCSTTCGRKSDLKQHMLKLHTSERPQKCRLCEASFPDRHNLKVHLRRHRSEKLLHCNVCNYKTNQQRKLHTHAMVHTGEKPHICTQCGLQFRLKQTLKCHLNKVHPEINISEDLLKSRTDESSSSFKRTVRLCSVCSNVLTSVSALRQHLRSVHKMTPEQIEVALINSPIEERQLNSSQESSGFESSAEPEETGSGNAVPTIVVTCTPDQVSAAVVLHDASKNSKLPDAKPDEASIEAIFILPGAEDERLSVLVEPQILSSEALLQSLQSALEQNLTMRNIAATAYKQLHGNSDIVLDSQTRLDLQTHVSSSKEILSGTACSTGGIGQQTQSSEQQTEEVEFSTIDASALQSTSS